jgi:HSP20 family protein
MLEDKIMNTQLWNPFQEFESLLERYNKSGRNALSNQSDTDLSFADWAPSVDIEEEEDSYKIKADLPGVDKKDIDVKMENGMLSIRGEKHTETESGKGSKRHRTERFHGSFARSFTLPNSVQADKIDAAYKDGVLTLVIPKSEQARPKSIDIKVS